MSQAISPKTSQLPTNQQCPPSFEESRNRRQKVRAAGMNPDYWYAVEYDRVVKPGQVVEVKFWQESIALYRCQSGQVVALENRCAHRQLPLTLGQVEGDRLVCCYHGWGYDPDGNVASIPHDLFNKPMPACKIRTYPVAVRYGLIWLFPGDAQLATTRQIPEIPELSGSKPWACVPLDFVWKAHHSMIIDNVSDFSHAYLHRKYRPFVDAKLTYHELVEDRVLLSYQTQVGMGRVSGLFVDRDRVNTNSMTLCYEYPYQWSNTDNKIKHWCFVLPIDERTTRAFFLFYFDALKIPLTSLRIPQWLMKFILKLANPLLIKPLLMQDGVAVEAEQVGYEKHFEAPIIELNPAVLLFQKLTIQKWEEFLNKSHLKRTNLNQTNLSQVQTNPTLDIAGCRDEFSVEVMSDVTSTLNSASD